MHFQRLYFLIPKRKRGAEPPNFYIESCLPGKSTRCFPLWFCLVPFCFLILKNRSSLGSQILLWFSTRDRSVETMHACALSHRCLLKLCDHQPTRLHCNSLGTSYRTTQKLQLVLCTWAPVYMRMWAEGSGQYLLSTVRYWFLWEDMMCTLEIFLGFSLSNFPNMKVFPSQNWDRRGFSQGAGSCCWASNTSCRSGNANRTESKCADPQIDHIERDIFFIQRLSVSSYPLHYLWLLREEQHWT